MATFQDLDQHGRCFIDFQDLETAGLQSLSRTQTPNRGTFTVTVSSRD